MTTATKWLLDAENYRHHLFDNLRQGGELQHDEVQALACGLQLLADFRILKAVLQQTLRLTLVTR